MLSALPSCEKLLQKVKSNGTFCNKICPWGGTPLYNPNVYVPPPPPKKGGMAFPPFCYCKLYLKRVNLVTPITISKYSPSGPLKTKIMRKSLCTISNYNKRS